MELDATTVNAIIGVGSAIGAAIVTAVVGKRRRESGDELEIDENKRRRNVMSDLMQLAETKQQEADKAAQRSEALLERAVKAEMRASVLEGDLQYLQEDYRKLHRKAQRWVSRLVQAGMMDQAEAGDLFTRFGELDEIPPAEPKR